MNPPNDNLPTVLVWDSDDPAPQGDWVTVLWRGFGASGGADGYSIPRRVEERAGALRARFLRWIHDLGEAPVDGERLLDRLAVRPGFSYWWMSLLAEKSYVKSAHLCDAVKLFALEDMVREFVAGRVILASGDQVLAQAFRAWCGNAGLIFKWRRQSRSEQPVSWVRKVYCSLPHPLQAVAYLLRYLKQRWPLRQVGTKALSKSAGRLTFCSYFDNLDMDAVRQGRFHSRYWTKLPEALAQKGIPTNWLQLYIPDDAVPTARRARDLITRLNRDAALAQLHVTPDGVLGWSPIWGAMRDFSRIVWLGLRLGNVRPYFRPANSNVNLWPLFKHDWRKSMYGSAALWNCLFLNLIERILVELPRQKLGAYLQENQGWEMALIHAWKSAGHGELIGVPHSCINFWDLRFFVDERAFRHTGRNDLPLPDWVALNGPAAIATYQEGGCQKNRMVEVEALRYLYLRDRPSSMSVPRRDSSNSLRVLVLTDFVTAVTHRQMQLLLEAASFLPETTDYIVKPHPNCPVRASDYPALYLQVTADPLPVLLAGCDIAYTSNTTSASVDAYCMGVPVVSMLDGDAFNMSPLRGLAEGVKFVTARRELAEALMSERWSGSVGNRAGFFTIDAALPRWKALLAVDENAENPQAN